MKLLILKISKSFLTFFDLSFYTTYSNKLFQVYFLTLQISKTSHSSVTSQCKNSEKWGPKKQNCLKAYVVEWRVWERSSEIKKKDDNYVITSLH